MANSHALLKSLRQLHLYIGIFISPAILFFALTGALQTFSLHETTKGSDYKPPAWVVKLGQLHKKQTLEVPQRKPGPPGGGDKSRGDRPPDAQGDKPKGDRAADAPGDAPRVAKGPDVPIAAPAVPAPKQKSHLPMKIFFLIVAISLMISTLTGLYMAYKFGRNKWVVTALLIAGVVVPLLLLPF